MIELELNEMIDIDGGCWYCVPFGHQIKDFVDGFLSAF
jgi:hypothetical protein